MHSLVKTAQIPRFGSRIVGGDQLRDQTSETVPMPFQAILDEVDQLHSVSTRLEGLAGQNAPMTEALMTIAGSVRNTATLLAVLVASRTPKPI